MAPNLSQCQQWLERDDENTRLVRAEMLQKSFEILPDEEMIFFGGEASAQAFIELRTAYVNGLFLTCVLLALSCIELEIAGSYHAKGEDNIAKYSFIDLIKISLKEGKITQEEFEIFDRMREIRNSYTHYRPPSHRMSSLRRSMTDNLPSDDLLEADATSALSALTAYLDRTATITIT